MLQQADRQERVEAAPKTMAGNGSQKEEAEKEIADALKEMAKAPTLSVASRWWPDCSRKRIRMKTLKHVWCLLMDGMRKDASMPSATNGDMMARLIAENSSRKPP